MRTTCSFLSAILLLLAGCSTPEGGRGKAGDTTKKGTGLSSTGPPPPDIVATVPAGIPAQAYKLLGFPFKGEIYYKMDGLPGRDAIEGARTVQVSNLKNGKLTVKFLWSGGFADFMNSELYEVDKNGVRALTVQGQNIQPPPTYLPADFRLGKTWTAKYSFKRAQDSATVSVSSVFKIASKQKVTVPLGTYEAWVIEETGTMSDGRNKSPYEGKSWLAEGIGIVKSVQTVDQNPSAPGTSKVTLTLTAMPKP
jgi:hypothetical protein